MSIHVTNYLNIYLTRSYLQQINGAVYNKLQPIKDTKLKPVLVTVAVSKKERKILGF